MNSRKPLICGVMVAAFAFILPVNGAEINQARAKFNYQMLCQGCHTHDGSGGNDIPELKGFIGNFLATKQGREYLVRVPGSANSALNSSDLAEVLNWIILEFGADSIPKDLTMYQADEVDKLRHDALFEVIEYRKMIIAKLPKRQAEIKQSTKEKL